jgi:hypothetical protein
MYRMNDKIRSSDLFSTTILELVKLIQAALSLFGFFSVCQDEWNGLLCDVTVGGIQRWQTEISEPQMAVEVSSPPLTSHSPFNLLAFSQPTERVADPVVVFALLSQVSSTRNKLYALGFGHVRLFPRPPFSGLIYHAAYP